MRDRILRGAGISAVGFVLSRAITFGGYVAIAALVSPETVGVFAAGSIVASVGVLFAESGMLAAVIQWRGDVDEAASTAFAATFVGGLLLTGFAAATSPLVGSFFHSDAVGSIALGCAGFLFLRSLTVVPDALLQRRFSFLRRVAVDPLGAAAFVAVAVVACSNGMGAWGLVLGTYALYLVQIVAAWGFARWRPRRSQMSFDVWRRLAGFGRHVVASEIVRHVTTQLDTLLLGRFAGAAVLGQYNYGMRLAGQPVSGFVSIVAYVLYPAFARVAETPDRLRRSFGESFGAANLLMIPVSLLLIPLGDQLALLAFGPEWAGAGDAIKALALIGVGWTWGSLASEGAKAAGRPQIITRMHLVALVTSLVLMPSLLWADAVGIGLAVSIAAMLSGAYGLRRVCAEMDLPLRELLRPMWGIVAAATVGVAAAGALDATVFAGISGRGEAAGAVAVETLVLVAAFLLALRVVAPATAGRIGALASRLRGRGAAVGA